MNLDSLIEAILFWKAEPITIKKLCALLDKNEKEIQDGLSILKQKLVDRGTVLVEHDEEVTLGTNPTFSSLIEKLTKEELEKDLGKAAVETLSIVLYRGPISRREIDYIRGVNSAFILRNLMIRGLVEKVVSSQDQRVSLYKPTLQLISYLGLAKIEQLPEYMEARTEIDQFMSQSEEREPNKKEVSNDNIQ